MSWSKIKIVASFTIWNINNILTVTREIIYDHETVLPLVSLKENDEQEIMYPAVWKTQLLNKKNRLSFSDFGIDLVSNFACTAIYRQATTDSINCKITLLQERERNWTNKLMKSPFTDEQPQIILIVKSQFYKKAINWTKEIKNTWIQK